MNNTHHSRIILIVILLSGVFLRLYGINHGLPYIYDPDEPDLVNRAFTMLISKDLNPHWFAHPGTTVIYLLSVIYSLILIGGGRSGAFANTADFELLYFQDPTIFYLSGRIMIMLFGVASILLLYAITCKLFNKTTGLIAAALFALSPLHVYYSKLNRCDILLTFLILTVFWFCLEIVHKRSWASYLLAGFFSGLAVATKYPAVIVVLIIVAAYIFSYSRNDFPKLIASGCASLSGAFAGSPYLFLDFRKVLADVAYEARSSHLSATGEGFMRNLLWYVQGPLWDTLSVIGLVLSAFGIFYCIHSKKKEAWLLIIFPLSFLIFLSLLKLRWDRWIIPVIPFFCVLIAHAFYRITMWVEHNVNSRAGNLGASILLLILVAPLAKADIIQVNEMSGKDTRTLAIEWILENIPRGSRILEEKYVPHLPRERYTFLLVDKSGKVFEVDKNEIKHSVFDPPFRQIGKLKDIETLSENNVQYIVFSNWYDRYLTDREKSANYAQIVDMYETIMKRGKKIFEITPVPGRNTGPPIRVYRYR